MSQIAEPIPSTEPEPHRPQQRDSPWALLTILFTIAVAVAMVGMIYWRWFSLAEPTAIIQVEADEAAYGAVATVERVEPGDRSAPITATFDESNGYRARFFVRAGEYQLSVSRADQPPIQYRPFSVLDNHALTVSVRGKFPSTMPAATNPSHTSGVGGAKAGG
jgi:hypothetical protein